MPDAAAGMTIARRFEAQVARTPDAVAIRAGCRTIDYDGLNRDANRLARAIREQAGERDPVAFLLDDGVDQILAVLALFKAGRIAVPLDPGYPNARLQAMLQDSGCVLVVESASTAELRAQIAPDRAALDIRRTARLDDDNPHWVTDAAAPANIYYTSGTTGEPKGVVQTQRNVLRFVEEMARAWEVTPADRFIQLISSSFSAVLLPTLVPLLNGASVAPFDLRREGLTALAGALADLSISVLFCVPSILRALPELPAPVETANRLRLCVFTGEPLHWSDIARLRERVGRPCAAINVFGGSEMHHVASLRIAPEDPLGQGVVPAGRPAPDKQLILVDAQGRSVPAGATGELVVHGNHLSPGYWRRPDLTRAAFIDAPAGGMRGYRSRDLGRFDREGLLELLGRADSRVKLRGQMVDTAAVEAAVAAFPGVVEAAVCVAPGPDDTGQLVAFVSANPPGSLSWPDLRERLADVLPAFMVPTSFLQLPRLLRGPGGKIDRQSLADLFVAHRASGGYAAPASDLERRIAAVAEAVLGQHPIGVRDDLFELGLDSLRYADLHVALERELGRRLPDEVFVQARTIAQLARLDLAPSAAGGETVPGGGQEYGKTWRRLDLEMRARYHAARFLGLLPFRWSFAGLAWLCRRATFRAVWPVRPQLAMIRSFLSTVEGDVQIGVDEESAISRSLCCNFVQPWLLRSLARAATADAEHRCRVDGLEYYRRARSAGRGVILAVSHFGIAHADLLVLDRTGERGIVTLGAFEYELKLMGLDHQPHVPLAVEPVSNFVFRANFLRRAAAVLQDGGVVRVAADGLHGTGGRTWPFHGRHRHFRPGLGELMLETGAPVVPVFGILEDTGRLRVEFLPPLDPPDDGMPRAAAVEACLEGYLRLLERRWALDPGSVVWEIARSHLDASRVNPA